MEMPTDVTCGEDLRKEQTQVSGILSEPNEEEVQLLHAIDILIPNQSVTSWSDDEDACRNSHSTMLQRTSHVELLIKCLDMSSGLGDMIGNISLHILGTPIC